MQGKNVAHRALLGIRSYPRRKYLDTVWYEVYPPVKRRSGTLEPSPLRYVDYDEHFLRAAQPVGPSYMTCAWDSAGARGSPLTATERPPPAYRIVF